MSKLTTLVSATIVLFFSGMARANPADIMPEAPAPLTEPLELSPIDENMSLSEPEATNSEPRGKPALPSYYPYRQQLTFRIGRFSESQPIKFEDLVLGFQYLFPKFLSPKLEAGADLHPRGEGHLHAGLRWIYFERSYFRPSVKVGVDHWADADEKLATLSQIENYFARFSATLEYVVWNPYSVRFETELLINHKNQYFVGTLGISRGW